MKGFPQYMYAQITRKPKPLPEDLDLTNLTAIVTGANGGLGLEAAKDLAERKVAKLILSARSTKNEEEVRKEIQKVNPSCQVEVWTVDYEDYDSLLAFGKRASGLERLDIVILNAGVRQLAFTKTATGHEQNLQVNHIGTSLLSLLLLPNLEETAKKQGKPSRLTIVSSQVHHWTPFHEAEAESILAQMDTPESMKTGAPHDRYGTTKLLNVLWMRQLATKVAPSLVVINAVDPGLCKSNLHRYENRLPMHIVSSIFSWTSAQGGHNISNAAVAQKADSHGAFVCSEQFVKEPSDFVISEKGKETQVKVWDETIALLQKEVPSFTVPAFA